MKKTLKLKSPPIEQNCEIKESISLKSGHLRNNFIVEKIVEFESEKYYVITLKHFDKEGNNCEIPFVIDFDDYDLICNDRWIYVNSGYIGSTCTNDTGKKIIYLHNV